KLRKGRLPLVRHQDEIPRRSEKTPRRQWHRDRHTLSQTDPPTSTLPREVRVCGRSFPAERVAIKRGLEHTNVPDPRPRRSGPGMRGSEEISSKLVPELSKTSTLFEICGKSEVYFLLNSEDETIIDGKRIPAPAKKIHCTTNPNTKPPRILPMAIPMLSITL